MPKLTSTNKPLTRRSASAPTPESMTRGAAAPLPADNPYRALMTREEDLTSEQTTPLKKREKPAPSEAVFPAPAPAEPVSPQSAATTLGAPSTPPPASMKRHQLSPEELKRAAWRCTRIEDLPAPALKPKKMKD